MPSVNTLTSSVKRTLSSTPIVVHLESVKSASLFRSIAAHARTTSALSIATLTFTSAREDLKTISEKS